MHSKMLSMLSCANTATNMVGKYLKKGRLFHCNLNVAWEKAMTKKNIIAGFKRSGLWPINRHVITPEQLGPSAVSDKSELHC